MTPLDKDLYICQNCGKELPDKEYVHTCRLPKEKDCSKCCNATVTIGGDDQEGTHYFICSKCNNPCDLAVTGQPANERDSVRDNEQQSNRMDKGLI